MGTTSTLATPPTIAIVDAYDDPNILSDLTTYSCQYRLPDCPTGVKSAATTSSIFQKVTETGVTPNKNSGWDLEIALDVETAHQMCQNCKILLVEANSNSGSDLYAAEDVAVKDGASEISNSWGTSSEYSGELTDDAHFNHPGVAITVASGDNGFNRFGFPAASPYVVAVGGTTLQVTGTNAWAGETTWNGTGSGCSVYEPVQSWQSGVFSNWASATGCTPNQRGVADVAADADPNTGAAVYDSVRYQGQIGWFQVGGTSLSSPLAAGIYALAGYSGSSSGYAAQLPYGSYGSTNLHDVQQGATSGCNSSQNIMCNAVGGYDGPTGVGSPNGLGGF